MVAAPAGTFCAAFGEDLIAVAEFDFKSQRLFRILEALNVAIHVDFGMRAKDVFRLGENIFDEAGRNDAEGDFAIDAAEGEVVNLIAEGRDVRPLGGVQFNGENVFAGKIEVRSEFERKGSVAAFVFAEADAVDPDGGGGHGAFKVHKDAAATRFRGQREAAAIDGDEFVGFFVEAVPGQVDVGVRNDDFIERGIIEGFVVCALDEGMVVAPVAIDGKNSAAGGRCTGGLRGFGKRGVRESSSGKNRAGCFQKIASVHNQPRNRELRGKPVNIGTREILAGLSNVCSEASSGSNFSGVCGR